MNTETDKLRKELEKLVLEKGLNSTGLLTGHFSPKTLDVLLKKKIQPALEVQKEIERILPTDPYFARAEKLREKYKLSPKGFGNFRKLLCGVRTFPCILLQNPINDHLEYKSMVTKTRTLGWLETELQMVQIKLEDIIIIDLFPMLTDEWIKTHPDERKQAIDDMFTLTLDFISTFKPPVIFSCQCLNPQNSDLWVSFKHEQAEKLRSSMRGAEVQRVSEFSYEDHITHIVHGFHPSSILRGMRTRTPGRAQRLTQEERRIQAKSLEREELLRKITNSLFKPYSIWQNKYILRKRQSIKKRAMKKLIEHLRQKKNEIDQIHKEGLALGMFQELGDFPTLDEWSDFNNALDAMLNKLSLTKLQVWTSESPISNQPC